MNVVDIVGEGTSPLHAVGSGGPPAVFRGIDIIFIGSEY